MEAPEQIDPQCLGDYLDVMSKAVFQSGMSWQVVRAKWPGTRDAFHGFDAEAVAEMTPADIDALVIDTRVIRNRKKLEAIVSNASKLIDLDRAHGGFRAYLRSHDGYDATVRDLRKQFKFMGESGCYFFLYVVGEPVPDYHAWRESRGLPAHI